MSIVTRAGLRAASCGALASVLLASLYWSAAFVWLTGVGARPGTDARLTRLYAVSAIVAIAVAAASGTAFTRSVCTLRAQGRRGASAIVIATGTAAAAILPALSLPFLLLTVLGNGTARLH